MPHKPAKRSVRERANEERTLDLPPSESTFTTNDIPKSMARVLNAEAIRGAWREKKRTLDEKGKGGEGGMGKKRRTESGPAIEIKPGESLRHFKLRVEDDMRPTIRSAMKSTSSISKKKLKQSQKDAEQLASQRRKHKAASEQGDSDPEDALPRRRKDSKKDRRSPSPDFVHVSSSAPKRLNDVAQAPPEIRAVPRLNRLVQKSQRQKAVESGKGGIGVITSQEKRMMELEREKAINRYRALKEAKLKEQRKQGGTSD